MAQLMSSSAEEAAARGAMYGLLARLWLREANRELVNQLGSPPLRDAFIEAGGVLPADSGGATIEQLEIDYCQLFVGPKDHLPPFQSVWQGGQLQGKPTESMTRYVDLVGYEIEPLPHGVMLDHLGVQLDVMSHIAGRIATRVSDPETSKTIQDLTHSYFAAHLRW
ncbi:MAG: molecular chaperone TorD family protein, partial [Planctomycetales bacterium]